MDIKPLKLFRSPNWQTCYEDFLASRQRRSGSTDTPIQYQSNLKAFFVPLNKSPSKVTRQEIESYLQQRLPDGSELSSSEINCRLTAIRSFYKFASRYTYGDSSRPLCAYDPSAGIEFLASRKTRRSITEEEFKAIFAEIPRDTLIGLRDFALLSTYFWTVKRREEVVRLRWGDLEPITFVENGKRRNGYIYHYTAKGKSREIQSAELPEPAVEAIRDYLIAAGKWEKMQADDPLFGRVKSGKRAGHGYSTAKDPLSGHLANAVLKKYVLLAGIDKPVSLHWLRRTAARFRWQDGKDILKIKALLGHSSLATTWIYLQEEEDNPDSGAISLAQKLGRL